MHKHITRSLLAALLGACAAGPALAELVANGGFENGASDWTTNMNVYQPAGDTHSGTFSIATGCQGHDCVSTLGTGAYFGQSLSTSAGGLYDLSFWVGETGGPASEFSVFWNGVQIADVMNPANDTLPASSQGGMVQYTVAGLEATGGSTYFEIHGRQEPSFMYFDDVSVLAEVPAPVNSVPEPSSLTLALSALLLFTLPRVRRSKRFDAVPAP